MEKVIKSNRKHIEEIFNRNSLKLNDLNTNINILLLVKHFFNKIFQFGHYRL
jgi:hypothetical protein